MIHVGPEDGDIEDYTHRYRETGRRNRDFDVFADAGRRPRRRPFATSYVDLSVAQRGGGGGTDAATVMREHSRVLLRGGAGAGKTTLLKRLELLVFDAPGDDGPIPFRLRLANLPGGELPRGDLSGFLPSWAESPPPGWIERMFDHGRAVVLLDGLDKVTGERRDALSESFDAIATRFPGARFWITTRHAVDDQPWLDRKFAPFDLLPMSRQAFLVFVQRWHAAAREDLDDQQTEERVDLEAKESRLTEVIDSRPRLHYMARVPLLCELLCFLHRQQGEDLPHQRKDVYDRILDILINKFGGPRPDIGLSWKRKMLLLEALGADFVLDSDEKPVARSNVIGRVRHSLQAMDDDLDAEEVLDWLLVHSGLFKEEFPEGPIRFVHQTFRDHLAGRYFANRHNTNYLLELAEATESHDVVAMAASHMSPQDAGRQFLDRLYEYAMSQREPGRRDTLLLAAMACLDQIDVLFEPDLEGRAPLRRRIRDSASPLLRPVDLDRARWLIEAGPTVINLLPTPREVRGQPSVRWLVRVLAVHAARGAPGALDALLAHVAGQPHLLQELIDIWPETDDLEEYAASVLVHVDFSDTQVSSPSRRCLPYLWHAATITSLRLQGHYSDLRPLKDLPVLRELVLFGLDHVNLNGLEEARSLRHLSLMQCSAPNRIDLGSVAHLGLEKLSISPTRDVRPVEHLVMKTLGGFSSRLPVDTLELTDPEACRGLDASTLPATLATLIVYGVPRPDEVARLVDHEHLRLLVIKDAPRGTRRPSLPSGACFEVSVEPSK